MSTGTNGTSNGAQNSIPSRLHHTAYVCKDLEETRKFYEDVLGWPLIAVWREHDIVFESDLTYCHLFFGLGDGGALAFFWFDDPAAMKRFSEMGKHSPFVHLAFKSDAATQQEIKRRLEAAGHSTFTIQHGYCESLYMTDPNGLNLEVAVDHPSYDLIMDKQAKNAHEDLKGWLRGDRGSNNNYRSEAPGASAK